MIETGISSKKSGVPFQECLIIIWSLTIYTCTISPSTDQTFNQTMTLLSNWNFYRVARGLEQEKRKRSDSALWQKPLHRQKNPKSNVTTQRTPPKTSITQRLRTDLGRSAGVTIATQLVWLNQFTGSQPSHSPLWDWRGTCSMSTEDVHSSGHIVPSYLELAYGAFIAANPVPVLL